MPISFGGVFMADELGKYYFLQGTNSRAYEYMGAHRDGGEITLRVWAPNATCVFLCADFNGWSDSDPMTREDGGIWTITVPKEKLPVGARYKYMIDRGGSRRMKSDPYAFMAQTRGETASIYYELDGYEWGDEKWLEKRKELSQYLSEGRHVPKPINIYEMHLGSWKRHEDGSYYTYSETERELIPYIKEMGYTHVELMPVAEHPFDGSWGYQCTNYYAPTSRFGTPHDFMHLVDALHQADIGVILDWVPAHFPKDEHGLYEFDGAPLYEYQGWDRMEHKVWGTRFFDLGRNEIQCFLISNAVYWCEKYHVDGLRTDAVSSMLYLNYDRGPGESIPNEDGSNHNRQAVAFLQKMNGTLSYLYPDVMLIAEEATAWKDITVPAKYGGLGFNYKWNMGWMNDTLDYLETDSLFRKNKHDKITFPIMYAFNERYILPISHDEVVHGKKTLVDKVDAEYYNKFATMRAYLTYMMTHPGKKLLFMGQELGQFCEWDEEKSVEWFMLAYDTHKKMQNFTKSLNHLYKTEPSLYLHDEGWNGFRWYEANNSNDSIFIYGRMGDGGDELVVAVNFTPVKRENYWMQVNEPGVYTEIFSSNAAEYGGEGTVNSGKHASKEAAGRSYVEMTMHPLTASIWRKVGKKPKPRKPRTPKPTENK